MTPNWDLLAAVLNTLAADTWYKLERSYGYPSSFSETTFTESHLFELEHRFPDLHVQPFKQSEEARNGADWEWVVGEHGVGWIVFRVQAKRVYQRTRTYAKLDYRGGPKVTGRSKGRRRKAPFQYETLIRGCDPSKSEFPLIVFYNGWPPELFGGNRWPTAARWCACPHGPGGCLDGCACDTIEHYGCSVAAATSVKVVHQLYRPRGNCSVPDHLSVSVPWSQLFNPSGGATGSAGWPDRIRTSLLDLFSLEDPVAARSFNATLDSQRFLSPEPPAWASLVQQLRQADLGTTQIRDVLQQEGVDPPAARFGVVTDLGGSRVPGRGRRNLLVRALVGTSISFGGTDALA